ncbi:MAG: hypothetical protein RR248_03520 [Clostridia bacterium]
MQIKGLIIGLTVGITAGLALAQIPQVKQMFVTGKKKLLKLMNND